ncbi:MAG: InlB B-repeat-containing protein [Spirochaetota bacterium]
MAAEKQTVLSTYIVFASALVLVLAHAACMLPTIGLAGTASLALKIELGVGGQTSAAALAQSAGSSRLVLPTAKSLTVVLTPKAKGLEAKTQTLTLQAQNLLNFRNLPIGSYSILATAFAGAAGSGASLFSQTVEFDFAPATNYLGLYLLPLAPFAPDLAKSPVGQRVTGNLDAGQSATWQLPIEALPESGDFTIWIKSIEKIQACGQYGSGEPFTVATGRSSALRGTYAKGPGYLSIYNAGASAQSYEFVTNPLYVDYDANGANSAGAPVDLLGYLLGEAATVADKASLTYTGKTFTGWNTTSDGTGSTFGPGSALTVNANTTLYAQWMDNSAPTAVVTFDVQTGTTTTKTVLIGKPVAKPADPTRPNYSFGGWYTEAACVSFYDFSSAVTAAMTLYAKWLSPPAISIDLANPSQPVVSFTNTNTGTTPSLSTGKAESMTVTASAAASKNWLWTIDGNSASTALGPNGTSSISVTADGSLSPGMHQLVLFFDDAAAMRHSATVSFKVTE